MLAAIGDADQIVLGPGSLYTSVLAACVVPGISEALCAATGTRVYVANLREQVPETSGYDVARVLASRRRRTGSSPTSCCADRTALGPIGRVRRGEVRARVAFTTEGRLSGSMIAERLAPVETSLC